MSICNHTTTIPTLAYIFFIIIIICHIISRFIIECINNNFVDCSKNIHFYFSMIFLQWSNVRKWIKSLYFIIVIFITKPSWTSCLHTSRLTWYQQALMIPAGTHDNSRHTWYQQALMIPAGTHDTSRLKWYQQAHMIPAGSHDTSRLTWYQQAHMIQAGTHDTSKHTWYQQAHMIPAGSHDTSRHSWYRWLYWTYCYICISIEGCLR